VRCAFAAALASLTIAVCAFAFGALALEIIVLCVFTVSMLVFNTSGTGALGAGVEPTASP
jgi:hypothetical protein